MTTTTAPNQIVIGLKRKNNGMVWHVQRAFKAFAYRTLQNSNVKSPN